MIWPQPVHRAFDAKSPAVAEDDFIWGVPATHWLRLQQAYFTEEMRHVILSYEKRESGGTIREDRRRRYNPSRSEEEERP